MKQRKHKYRAWNRQDKIMIYGVQQRWEHKDASGNEYDACYDWDFGDFIDDPEMIIMQHSGLKDKNKKEIYEGDIYKAEVENNKYQAICEFKNGGFTLPVLEKNGNPFGDCEVIGNIYENKDLLKNGLFK